jgi:hypothetical protein
MSQVQEFRKNAAIMFDLANHAPTSAYRAQLLTQTEAWLDLADEAQRTARKPVQKMQELPPLIRPKLRTVGSGN